MDITLAGGVITYEPTNDQLSRVSIALAAMDGEFGGGVLPVPDPTTAISIHTGRKARIDEAGVCISNGFILDRENLKGPQPQAGAREYGFGIMDANALLHGFRMEHVRPAETGYARVLACIGDLPGGTIYTYVSSAGEYTMPAKTYATDGGWEELITDLVEFTGKTLFLHDTVTGARCLHYHALTLGHTCGLTISDNPSAVDGVTVFAPQQPDVIVTSVDLTNDVKGRDQAGRTATATDATSITNHDADGLKHQTLKDFEAGSQSDLNQKVAVFLANQKEDQNTYSCSIGPLDSGALYRIRVGDLITITSQVMGLSANALRISHMTLTPYGSPPSPGLWNAALEMGAPKRRRSRTKPVLNGVVIGPGTTGGGGGGGGGTSTGCCPPWDGIGSPTSGQQVFYAFVADGDGVTTAWTTAFPYMSATLRVYLVDTSTGASTNVTGDSTEDDNTTGAFSLGTIVPTASPLQKIYVSYYAL